MMVALSVWRDGRSPPTVGQAATQSLKVRKLCDITEMSNIQYHLKQILYGLQKKGQVLGQV